MTALGWTLLGLAAVAVAVAWRLMSDAIDGLEAENRELARRIREMEGRGEGR